MNIQKAINVIEKVSILIVEKVPPYFVADALNGKFNNEQFDHILDKWFSKDGDLFDFYLNSSSDIQRYLLEALDIEVEPDKYPDYDSRIMAELSGKKRSEIYPFETEILREYVLFSSNNSLTVLDKVSPSAWKTVNDYGIAYYGNYLNWSVFWYNAEKEDKELLLNFITNKEQKQDIVASFKEYAKDDSIKESHNKIVNDNLLSSPSSNVSIENIHDLAFLKAIKEGDLGKLVSLKNEGYMPPNRILESIVKKNTVNTLVTIEKIYDVKIESLKYNDIKLAENDNCQISKDKGLEF